MLGYNKIVEELSIDKAKKAIHKARQIIKEYFIKYKLKYAVFGKSMGLDSSVVGGLLAGIPQIKPLGVVIPIESDPKDAKIAKIVLDHFKIPYIAIDLTEIYQKIANKFYEKNSVSGQLLKIYGKIDKNLSHKISSRKRIALGNIKVRLRMVTLYHVAQLTGGIVIATGNCSEWWTGFWTLHGDVGDFYPIGEIFKGKELYVIAKVLGVPKESLEAEPADGLMITPKGIDEEQLGLPYEHLDKVIFNFLQNKSLKEIRKVTGLPEIKVKKVVKRIKATEFKRKLPFKISRGDLGLSD